MSPDLQGSRQLRAEPGPWDSTTIAYPKGPSQVGGLGVPTSHAPTLFQDPEDTLKKAASSICYSGSGVSPEPW